MGLLADIFGTGNKVPTIISILPVAAKQEIEAGRLPILNTDQLFLKKGEKIHFIDKAINLEIKTVKQYQHVGHSGPLSSRQCPPKGQTAHPGHIPDGEQAQNSPGGTVSHPRLSVHMIHFRIGNKAAAPFGTDTA